MDWETEDQIARHARGAGERALWLLRAHGRHQEAGMPTEVSLLIKAAAAGLTTGNASAIAQLRAQSEAIVAPATAAGLFDALRADAVPGDFYARYAVAVSRLSASAHVEGGAIPVTNFAVGAKQLTEQQAMAIIIVTAELLRFANAPQMFEAMLREGIARATDDIAVPQLISGAPTVAASGPDSIAVAFDLRRALQAINSGSASRFHVGLGVDLAKRLSMLTDDAGQFVFPAMSPTGGFLAGGRNAGLPAHVTESLTDDVVVTDATAILAASGDVQIDVSRDASIEMNTAPTNAVTPTAQNMVGLFATGSAALRVARAFDFTALRTPHSCVVTDAGAAWGLTDTSPPL